MLDFVGIGAQKAGTTWLYENLSRHPEIAFPATKEVHFWDYRYNNGIDWYKGLFNVEGKKNGEITPAYAILSVEKIQEVYANFPDLRLIYLVRDPIERAWSSARMALKRAEMTMEEASDQWFIDHFNSKGSRLRGDYAQCIKNWLEVYPKEQLLVLQYEQIKNNPAELLRACCVHIGVNVSFYNNDENYTSGKIFAGEKHPLRPQLRGYLESIYADKIKLLEKNELL